MENIWLSRPAVFEQIENWFSHGARSRLWHRAHILDKIDWKCFIRQWLLVADLQTNISHRKHFRILPSFVIPRDWNLNGSVWIKIDPEFIISVIYCRCCVLIKHCSDSIILLVRDECSANKNKLRKTLRIC